MTHRIGRRGVLGGTLAAGVPGPARAAVMLPDQAPKDPLAAFPAWLDTLIPADEAPSATALGLDAATLAEGPNKSQFLRIATLGCGWLDGEARKLGAAGFVALDQPTRDRIAEAAQNSPPRSMPWAFFNTTRAVAFAHYYARPESWAGLGISRPPQPEGYPDHADPPR
jgi:hypothetical protein